jgi:hypothetical protein
LELALEAQWIGTLLHTFVEIAGFYAQLGDIEEAARILLSVLRDGRIVIPMQQQIRARLATLLPALDAEIANEIQHANKHLDIEKMARDLIRALQSEGATTEDVGYTLRDAERENVDFGKKP